MARHLPSLTPPRLFAGFCATCGRDIWEGDTARTDGVDLYCSAECAGEALTREVYARANGRDERVGEDALTLDEALDKARKHHRLRGHAMGLVLSWQRAAEYAKRQGWDELARRYHAVAEDLARIVREIESPATTGPVAGEATEKNRGRETSPSLPA